MKVKELIEWLSMCDPDDIVMFDLDTTDVDDRYEGSCGIEDVLRGSGTLRGFTYLSAKEYVT